MTHSLQPRARLLALPSPTLAQADDPSLAQAAWDGDPRAASVIWDRYSPLARRMLRRVLGPASDVEPLLQIVFLRVFEELGSASEASGLRSLVVSNMARVASSQLRWRSLSTLFRPRPRESGASDEVPMDPLERDALSGVYRLLDRLDPTARLVFALRHFEGMAEADIAQALAIPYRKVERHLSRAAVRMQKLGRREPALRAYAATAADSIHVS